MKAHTLHGVEITDRAGKLDCVLAESRGAALETARHLYADPRAARDRWQLFYVRYLKRGTYSRLVQYEPIANTI